MLMAFKDVEVTSGDYCLFQLLVEDLKKSNIKNKEHKIESLELLIKKYQDAETKEVVEYE